MENKETIKETLTLLIARLVTCSTETEIDGEDKNLGHIGVALLGSKNKKYFELVLYKETNEHLQRIEIDKDFQFHIDSEDTASVRDKKNGKWTLQFQSNAYLTDFASHIGLVRWIVTDMSAVLVQEMPTLKSTYTDDDKYKEKQCAKPGDYVEIYYSAKIVTNKLQFGIEVANNFNDGRPLVSKISSEWDKGLIGATVGSRRLLIIPNSCLGIWKCLVPNCQHLSLLVKVLRFGESESEFEMWKEMSDFQPSTDVLSTEHSRVCRPGHGSGPSPRLLLETLTEMKVYNSKMKEYCSQIQFKNSEMKTKLGQLLKSNLKVIQELEENILENNEKKNLSNYFLEHPDVKDMHGKNEGEEEMSNYTSVGKNLDRNSGKINNADNDQDVFISTTDALPKIDDL